MVKNREFFVLSLVVLLVFLVFSSTISADYSVGENKSYELSKKKYGPGENIEGWINMSFDNEPVDGVFSWGDMGATLKQLLHGSSGLNEDYDNYSCDFENCEDQYIITGEGETEKSVLLNESDSAIFGINLEGDLSSVGSSSFNMSSNAGDSCNNQIEIDLFDDGKVDMINTNNHSDICEGEDDYGCFDESHDEIQDFVFDSSDNKYCQKINITRSPGVELGAYMKNESGSTNLSMKVYDMNNNVVGDCDLPYPSNEWSEIGCSLNHMFVEEKESYYVCLERKTEVTGEYSLKGYIPDEDEKKCGSNSISPFEPTKAFQIFAKEKRFGVVNEFEASGIGEDIQDYLEEEFGDLDCSSHNCVIPIKVTSNVNNQNVEIKNAEIKINYEGGGSSYINDVYNANKVPANITTTGYDKFYFNDANLTIPEETDNFTFNLNYKGEEIIDEELEVVEIPSDISLSPLETSTIIETDFRVDATSAGNITSYSWDFGDNNTDTTTKNTVSHTYDSTGNYTVTVNVTDEFQRTGSKSFDVLVSTPNETVKKLLNEKKNDLDDFESELSSYSIFKKDMLNKHLDITKNKDVLDEIDSNYTGSNTEDELEGFAKKLIDIKIPSSISETASGNGLPTSSDSEHINPNIVSTITEEEFDWDQEQDYTQAIEEWNTVNLNNRISYQELTVQFNGNPQSYDFFEISIIQTPESNADEFYFFMEDLENLEISGINVSEASDDYVYDRLTGEKTISVFTTEDTSFENLPYFISPKLSEVSVNDTEIEPEDSGEGVNWVWYVIAVVVLAILGLVGYYFLQRWYDKRYEDSLFKDKNKLYNLANYITQAKNNGMSNSEIRKNLKKADWSGEQIRYVMKKYAGKRTGLPKLFGSIFGDDKPKKPKKSQAGRGRNPRRQRRTQR